MIYGFPMLGGADTLILLHLYLGCPTSPFPLYQLAFFISLLIFIIMQSSIIYLLAWPINGTLLNLLLPTASTSALAILEFIFFSIIFPWNGGGGGGNLAPFIFKGVCFYRTSFPLWREGGGGCYYAVLTKRFVPICIISIRSMLFFFSSIP